MSKNNKNNGIKILQKSEEKTIAAIIILYHPIDHMANGYLQKNITKVSKFCQFKPHGILLFRISLYLKMRHRFTVI